MEPILNPMPTVKRSPGEIPPATIDVPTTRGWDTDRGDTAKVLVRVSELLNMRKQLFGYETRSGYKQRTPANDGRVPVWKIPYQIDDVQIDVTFYYQPSTGVLGAVFYNTQFFSDETVPPIDTPLLTLAPNSVPTVTATQWSTFIIFSVAGFSSGCGTYRMSPVDLACSGWATPVLLGKAVCPTPTSVRFAETVTGDLIMYDAGNTAQSNVDGLRDVLQAHLFHDMGAKEPRLVRLPVDAKYFLVMGQNRSNWISESYPWYERDPQDATPLQSSNTPPGDGLHNPTRAYGYRFVPVQTFTDVKGQEFTFRGAPSTDLWIPCVHYSPAQILPHYTDTVPVDQSGTDLNAGSGTWLSIPYFGSTMPFIGTNCDTDHVQRSFIPSQQEFIDLRDKYRALVNDTGYLPYLWMSYYFGMRAGGKSDGDPASLNMDVGPTFNQQPFKPYVSAFELRRAPFAVFDWNDFTGLPAGTTEIEVYRTAYAPPQAKDIESVQPLFEAHKFGYAGSIKPGQNFTDDVTDEALAIDANPPEEYNGYLSSDFSGAVIRVHDDHIVLGDIYTRSHILPPVQVVRRCTGTPVAKQWATFAVSDGAGRYDQADLMRMNPSTVPMKFYLQYVDSFGRVSDLTLVSDETTPMEIGPADPSAGGFYSIWFTLPRGYAPSITAVNIIRAENDPLIGYRYFLLASVPVSQSNYHSTGLDAGGLGFPIDPTNTAKIAAELTGAKLFATVTTSHDPGTITWSDADDIMQWKPSNNEQHHQFAAVVSMSMVLGPLYVYTKQSVTKTDLQGRFENDNDQVGALGRNCLVHLGEKVDIFLSQNGLCISEGSSQRFIRGDIHTEVLKYLRETIHGQPALANARRAAIGLVGRGRQEIWLRFPSSSDLGGTLPARIFVYREFEFTGLQDMYNYEFDLDSDGSPSPGAQGIVYFASHTDGRLFSAHNGGNANRALFVQDNDTDDPWPGLAALELRLPIEDPTLPKRLERMWWWGENHSTMKVMTGIQRADGTHDRITGMVSSTARIFPVGALAQGNDQAFLHRIQGPGVETTARVPIVRFMMTPDKDGSHHVTLTALRLQVVPMGPGNNR